MNSAPNLLKKLLIFFEFIKTHETAFHYCADVGNNDVLCTTLEFMSTSDIQKAMNKQTTIGWTPLLIACHRGHMELVNTMLNNHARVDVFDLEGRSALHLAADRGYLQVNIEYQARWKDIQYRKNYILKIVRVLGM